MSNHSLYWVSGKTRDFHSHQRYMFECEFGNLRSQESSCGTGISVGCHVELEAGKQRLYAKILNVCGTFCRHTGCSSDLLGELPGCFADVPGHTVTSNSLNNTRSPFATGNLRFEAYETGVAPVARVAGSAGSHTSSRSNPHTTGFSTPAAAVAALNSNHTSSSRVATAAEVASGWGSSAAEPALKGAAARK